MGRKKVAPTVEWFVNEAVTPGGSTPRAPGTRDQARRELRALLAVARAARAAVRVDYEAPRPSPDTIAALIRELNRVDNALARLERAGKEEGL